MTKQGEHGIAWCDFTINPIRFRNKATGKIGHYCEKISAGCAHCYASEMQKGPYLSGLEFTAANRDKGELFFDEAALQQVLRRRKPARIFWCDMTDLFGAWVPQEWQDRCFATMALTPHLTHLALTKRAHVMWVYVTGVNSAERFHDINMAAQGIKGTPGYGAVLPTQCDGMVAGGWPLPNVWPGVSCENQAAADERIPLLLQIPAAVRWVSIEPMVGAVDLAPWLLGWDVEVERHPKTGEAEQVQVQAPRLDWVVLGGESGPNARPFDLRWPRSIIGQCKAAGVRCFLKQIGTRPVWSMRDYETGKLVIVPGKTEDPKGADPAEWPLDLRVRELPGPREQGEVTPC